jgi:hypothetical protein
VRVTERSGKQSETARCGSSRRKRRGSGGMSESMNRDGGAGEMRSMKISKVSVSMGQRLSLEVTMIDIGGIDIHILIGIGAVRGAEADQESADADDHVREPEMWNPNSIGFSYESHDSMKSTMRFDT